MDFMPFFFLMFWLAVIAFGALFAILIGNVIVQSALVALARRDVRKAERELEAVTAPRSRR